MALKDEILAIQAAVNNIAADESLTFADTAAVLRDIERSVRGVKKNFEERVVREVLVDLDAEEERLIDEFGKIKEPVIENDVLEAL